MTLEDVMFTRAHDGTFELRVDGDQCYGEDCTGCCGYAYTWLTRAEVSALRDALNAAVEVAT